MMSSEKAFNLDHSKIVSFGKELDKRSLTIFYEPQLFGEDMYVHINLHLTTAGFDRITEMYRMAD